MSLVERGKVHLNDPLTKYIPDYPTQGHSVLVKHLLQHTSGIKEFFTVPGFEEIDSGSPEKYSRLDLINLFKSQPFQFAPGERWAYSNSNYTLLGVIIEKATGLSYEDYLQKRFFRPLGLNATQSFGSRTREMNLATGYLPNDESFTVAPPTNINAATGDGGLSSTVLDLVKWEQALVHGQVVSRSSYRRMITPELVRRGYKPDYGFGLSLITLDGRRRVGHNGDITGFTGALAHYPEDDLSVATLINRAQFWPETIEKAVARVALGLPTPRFKDLPLRRAEMQVYVGTYDFGVFPLEVKEEKGKLEYHMGMGRPPYRLAYQGNHTFIAESDPDAIRLTFSLSRGRVHKLLIEMAAMHWYAYPMPRQPNSAPTLQ